MANVDYPIIEYITRSKGKRIRTAFNVIATSKDWIIITMECKIFKYSCNSEIISLFTDDPHGELGCMRNPPLVWDINTHSNAPYWRRRLIAVVVWCLRYKISEDIITFVILPTAYSDVELTYITYP
jgi:hypothetical protein